MGEQNFKDYTRKANKLVESYTGVRAVRPVSSDDNYRLDGGYQNVMNKYGTSRDSSEYYTYVADAQTNDQELACFYEQNGLFARIIDAPAEEAVKHGFELKDLEDDEVVDFINECLEELDWEETAIQCVKWARLFGGSIAVMLINDGRGLEEPVDWKNIRSIDDIRIFDRSAITPDYESMYKYDNQDPFRTRGSRLGYPEKYQISSKSGIFTVHEQRCLIFQNGVLPENTPTSQYQLWGMPEYVRIQRAVKDVEIAHGLAPKMLDRSVQAIYTMKDLSLLLSTEEGEGTVLKRLQTIDMAKGLLNTMILDADGEGYDFRSFSYTGVSDVINTTCNYLSALTNIPQTVLFGRSPAGMNSTGSSDLENYYNYVERIQKRMLKSNLRYLISVICQAGLYTKEIKKVPKIRVEFNSLWSMSESERVALDAQKASVEATKANTAVALVNAQILDPSEVRREYAKEDEFDIDTMLDDYTEEELEENAPQQQQGGMGGMMGGMPGGGGEDPMAALMGGMPQGGEEKTPKPTAEQAENKSKPSGGNDAPKPVKETEEKGEKAPNAAPEASKLPEDMKLGNEEENKDSEEEIDDEQKKLTKVSVRNTSEETKAGDAHDYNGGVGVLVIQRGKILTGTRIAGDAGGYGEICGPGGHIDFGETPEEAAYRETEEEFGIRPMKVKLLGVIGDNDPEVKKSYIYVANEYFGDIKCDDTEMKGPEWRSLSELMDMQDMLFKPFKDSLSLLIQHIYREDDEENIHYDSIDVVFGEI